MLAAAGVPTGDATATATAAGERSDDGGSATDGRVDVAPQRHPRTNARRESTAQKHCTDRRFIGGHANPEVSGCGGLRLVLVSLCATDRSKVVCRHGAARRRTRMSVTRLLHCHERSIIAVSFWDS